MNLYYMIWVDGIKRMQSVAANRSKWKTNMMTYMSMAMALNFMLIIAILQRYVLKYDFYAFERDFFLGEKLNNFVSFFLFFLFPSIVVNYLFIFRNNRFEKLIERYKYYNGKLFFAYFFGTMLLLIISSFYF